MAQSCLKKKDKGYPVSFLLTAANMRVSDIWGEKFSRIKNDLKDMGKISKNRINTSYLPIDPF